MRSLFALLALAGLLALGALASSAVAEIIGRAQPTGPVVTSFSSVARIKTGDTDCSGCDLSDASFRNTDLSHVNFSGAILKNADLTGAKLRAANISDADLSTAKGLTQAQIDFACGDAATKLPRRLHVQFCP
jgi:Pentapeptide repeats (8 copies)